MVYFESDLLSPPSSCLAATRGSYRACLGGERCPGWTLEGCSALWSVRAWHVCPAPCGPLAGIREEALAYAKPGSLLLQVTESEADRASPARLPILLDLETQLHQSMWRPSGPWEPSSHMVNCTRWMLDTQAEMLISTIPALGLFQGDGTGYGPLSRCP